jgi:hypothetical protein
LQQWAFLNTPAKAPAMKNLSPEVKMLATLQGEVIAIRTVIGALLASLPAQQLRPLLPAINELAEASKSILLGLPVPDESIAGYDGFVAHFRAIAEKVQ